MDFKEIYDKLTEKSESDKNFKEDVLKDAKKALKEKLDVDFEEGVNVKVVESTPDHLHFVLPMVDKDKLSKVTGGMENLPPEKIKRMAEISQAFEKLNSLFKGSVPMGAAPILPSFLFVCKDCSHTFWVEQGRKETHCQKCGGKKVKLAKPTDFPV